MSIHFLSASKAEAAANSAASTIRLRAALGALDRITVWRIVSKDPDEIAEFSGVLVRDGKTAFHILVDGDTYLTAFIKHNSRGVTVWRRAAQAVSA